MLTKRRMGCSIQLCVEGSGTQFKGIRWPNTQKAGREGGKEGRREGGRKGGRHEMLRAGPAPLMSTSGFHDVIFKLSQTSFSLWMDQPLLWDLMLCQVKD